MCGRFNIIDDPLTKLTSELLGINFTTSSNSNVCPSELISTASLVDGQISQVNANWGIKPSWSKKLLINAQSETVATKKTFKSAFASHRCVIPFSGWYEWKTLESGFKQKYLFSNDENVLFMAAILFEQPIITESRAKTNDLFGELPAEEILPQLVSLTTEANQQCAPIHHRMPLILDQSDVLQWIEAKPSEIGPLLFNKPMELRIQAQ